MSKFQTRRLLKNVLFSRLSLVVLVLLVGLLAKSVWDIYKKSALTAVNKERVMAELAQLEDRHSELSTRISKLETPRGIEEEVRKNLPVVKEGEKVITIVGSTTALAAPLPWWRRWAGKWR